MGFSVIGYTRQVTPNHCNTTDSRGVFVYWDVKCVLTLVSFGLVTSAVKACTLTDDALFGAATLAKLTHPQVLTLTSPVTDKGQ